MKYIDEFRRKDLARKAAEKIHEAMVPRQVRIMEVCGTHTQSFHRFGLANLLPAQLHMLSGPGCPVCVSTQRYIDQAITLAKHKEVILLTFGDMLRVPGTHSNLEKERAQGARVQILYSALESLAIAHAHPDKKIIFLAVGFETTAPTIALTMIRTREQRVKNLFFLTSLKTMPPALQYLVSDARLNVDGLLLPGHVSSIIGMNPYAFIPKEHKIPCCIAGFEPLDILEGILSILQQIRRSKPCVANQYVRVVRRQGNPRAQKIIARVFRRCDAEWRGLGNIPKSGLRITQDFFDFDAEKVFPVIEKGKKLARHTQCRCGDVLKGLVLPKECRLFAKACTPDHPIGPCMVSYEGACNAYFKYR
ncbi:MAG: hydrogenase formation protein HypD [Candidatus Omnitrophica bacterium]|nr:hydrogenase formation protein HypD [Candidatus Omnitrophota bacterium]